MTSRFSTVVHLYIRHTVAETNLRRLNTLDRFSVIVYKGDNFVTSYFSAGCSKAVHLYILHTVTETHLRRLNTFDRLSATVYKGDNFCDSLFFCCLFREAVHLYIQLWRPI